MKKYNHYIEFLKEDKLIARLPVSESMADFLHGEYKVKYPDFKVRHLVTPDKEQAIYNLPVRHEKAL